MPEQIQIVTDEGPRLVAGYAVQPGLAATRTGEGWTLTHVLSGRRLSSYGDVCHRCVVVLGKRATGVDWTQPMEVLLRDPMVAAAVWRFDRSVEYCTGDCG